MEKPIRITIMLDGELDKKLRVKQAKEITRTNKTCSFSKILNQTVRKGLKLY